MTFETWLRSLGADENQGIIASTKPVGSLRDAPVRGVPVQRNAGNSEGWWLLALGFAALIAAYAFLGSFLGPIPVVIVG
jgi:hypothetical protein